jgi:hypothetical protein
MKKTYQWIKDRLSEWSTWRGVIYLALASFALWMIYRSPENAGNIATAVIALATAFVISGADKIVRKDPPP